MKKALFILFLILTISLCGCKETSNFKIVGDDTIEIGFSSEYKVYLNDEELDNNDIYWILDNTKVVSRIDNKITGVSSGLVNLKAVLKSDSSVYASKSIEVIESIVDSIDFRGAKSNIEVGEQFIVSIIAEPLDAIDSAKAVWTVDTEGVVDIDPADDSAIITGLKAGKVCITAKCSSAVQSFELIVSEPFVEIMMNNDYEVSLSSTLLLDFNIDNPYIEVLTDNIKLYDNYLYAKDSGVGKIKVSQKGNKKLEAKIFDINVVENDIESKPMTENEKSKIQSLLANMSVKEKIGQMMMVNFQYTNTGWRKTEYAFNQNENGLYYYANKDESNKVYLTQLLNNYPFGNYSFNSLTSQDVKAVSGLSLGMQNYFIHRNKIGGIIALTDSAYSYQSGAGFNTYYENLVLGTVNNFNSLNNHYKALASDLNDAGVNLYITADYTYTNNSLDMYSLVQEKQVLYSSVMNNTLRNNSISASPIFGIVKNELNQSINDVNNNLIHSAMNDGIQAITITNTKSFKSLNGLSPQEYLRNCGYNGIIIDNETHYDTSQRYYYSERDYESYVYYDSEYYVNAINSGVDVFKIDIYLEHDADRWNYRYLVKNEETFKALNALEDLVNENVISLDAINKSVERILLYKIRNGIIDGTYPMDDYQRNEKNQNMIYSITNGYNVISSEGTFKPIDKANPVVIYYGNGEINSLIGGTSYYKRGYKELVRYQINATSLDEETEDAGLNVVKENTTAILFIDGTGYTYTYEDYMYGKNGEIVKDESNNPLYTYYSATVSYKELALKLKERTSKLILVFTTSPLLGQLYEDIDAYKIYCNYQCSTSLVAVFDIFEKGNAGGVTLSKN